MDNTFGLTKKQRAYIKRCYYLSASQAAKELGVSDARARNYQRHIGISAKNSNYKKQYVVDKFFEEVIIPGLLQG